MTRSCVYFSTLWVYILWANSIGLCHASLPGLVSDIELLGIPLHSTQVHSRPSAPRACDLHHLANGKWLILPQAIPLQSQEFIVNASVRTGQDFNVSNGKGALTAEQRDIYGPVVEAYWPTTTATDKCTFKVYDMDMACQCLERHRVILGFGDSLMRRIMQSWMSPSSQLNQYDKETHVPLNITQVEESSLLPCEDRGSTTKVIKLSAWSFQQLETHVVPTLDALEHKGHRVSVLFVGFGIHNVYFAPDDIQGWVNRTLSSLSSHPATRSARVFWMLPHQVAVSRLRPPHNETRRDYNTRIRYFNDVVLDTVHHPNWTILDFYNLTKEQDIWSGDGIHFSPGIFRWKNQRAMHVLCT